jgi:hypothetical protein
MRTKIQTVTFLFIIFFSFQLKAQQVSRYPIKPGSVWRINYEYSCMDLEFTHQLGDEEYMYFINGDTLIGNRTYYKLFKTGILYLESPLEIKNNYKGAIRDSADHFYYVENAKSTEKLLYNFAATEGETIYGDAGGMEYHVSEIDSLEGGRKKYYVDVMTVNCGSANCLIEGIGWLGGLLEGNACYSHPGVRGSYLLCYSENGIPVYETENSRCGKKMTCNTDITSIKEPILSKIPEITILPGGLLEICFSERTTDLYSIEIFNLQGKRLNQITTELPTIIDSKNKISGTFLIRISNDQMKYTTKYINR